MPPTPISTQSTPSSTVMEGEHEGSNVESRAMASEDHPEQDHLPYDPILKTAYYNHASEKSISHAEAKLIYRRHLLETSDQETQGSLKRPRTISSAESDGGLKRVGSRMSDSTCILIHSHLSKMRDLCDAPIPVLSSLILKSIRQTTRQES